MLTDPEIVVMKSALGENFDLEKWKERRRARSRIPLILDLIKDLWNENPDQRLFQLLMNVMNFHGDPFAIEDTELRARLLHAMEQYERKTV